MINPFAMRRRGFPRRFFCMIQHAAAHAEQAHDLALNPPRTDDEPHATWLRRAFGRPSGRGIAHWLHSFSLHVVTGFVAVAAHYALMYGLLRAGQGAVGASACGFVAGAATRFVLSYVHIFAPTQGVHAAGARFAVAIAAQLAANSALLAILTHQGVPVWPAQVATTVVLTFANYLVYRWWVFR
jgi:putative flippase GtrA